MDGVKLSRLRPPMVLEQKMCRPSPLISDAWYLCVSELSEFERAYLVSAWRWVRSMSTKWDFLSSAQPSFYAALTLYVMREYCISIFVRLVHEKLVIPADLMRGVTHRFMAS